MKFSELNERAKERAREWWRQGFEFDSEHVIEDAATVADLFGLDIRQTRKHRADGSHTYEPTIYWSGFCSQGDGASFVGKYKYKDGALKAVKEFAPKDETLHRIVSRLLTIQRKYFYKLRAEVKQSGRYYHSHTMSVELSLDSSYPMNLSRDLWHGTEDAVLDCMRDFADWIYRNLEREYDYQISDGYVDEVLTINDYEFDEEGKLE